MPHRFPRNAGDTITATATASDGATVSGATYVWTLNGTQVGTGSSYTVPTTAVAGDVIVVTATGGNGSASATATVANNTVVLSYSDTVQADGTYLALSGGKFTLSYGSGLGTPTEVKWYKDSAIVSQYTSAGGFTGAFNYSVSNTSAYAGKYYVEITNTEGKTYTSNVIELTTAEAAAVISGFEIVDDYDAVTTNSSVEYVRSQLKITQQLSRLRLIKLTMVHSMYSKRMRTRHLLQISRPQAV